MTRRPPAAPTTLAALTADPANRRRHDQRNLDAIAASLKDVGAARSIVIDEDDVILAGNGVTQAARAAGLTKLRVVEATGDEIIAVRRRGLTDAQKRALAIFDNRTAELATWNVEQLLADQAAGLELGAWWTDEELAALLNPNGAPKQGKTDPDAVPEVRATDIQRGDLFELGAHRLLCGDSTVAADVARVMGEEKADAVVTDSPYGIQRKGITNDDEQGLAKLFDGLLMVLPLVNGIVINFQSPRLFPIWLDAIRAHRHTVERSLWFYDETDVTFPWRGWLMTSQMAIVSSVGRATWPAKVLHHHDCYVVKTAGQQHDGDGHPTVKPVDVIEDLVRHTTGTLYDPFLGSGTTLIACEQLTRACRAIEIEPQYVQVALDRWEAFTGQRAEKVGEAVRSQVTPASVTHGPKKARAQAARAAAKTAPAQTPQPAPARRRRA